VALVLCTGVDIVLIQTRKLILEKAGHTVIAVTQAGDFASACEKYGFDVAVIGQDMSSSIKKSVFSLLREQCPAAKILELYAEYQGKTLQGADSWLEVPIDVPRDLPERVNELAGKKGRDTDA